MLHEIGIAEMKVANDPDDVIVTHSLGSCIGLSLYDTDRKIGGLIHCILPMMSVCKNGHDSNPLAFVDTGVVALIDAMTEMGCSLESMHAKVAGASSLYDEKRMIKIGERNFAMLKKVLWKNDIMIESADVGGQKVRSMQLRIRDGVTTVRIGKVEIEL